MRANKYHTAITPYVIFEEKPKTVKKIEQFRDLPVSWHYGDGQAARLDTIDRAKEIFNQYTQMGFTVTDAFPGRDGEIMVTAYKDNYYIECVVETDGTYSVVGERDKDVLVDSAHLDEGKTIAEITQIAKRIWNIFGLYILSTSIKGVMNLRALHSETPHTMGRPPYFYANAWTEPKVVGVRTSEFTTSR
jgi:hypothetical protein